MNTNYNLSIDELVGTAESSSSGQNLSDGMYAGVVIGYAIVKTEYKDQKTGEVNESIGAQLIVQIKDDNEAITHVATSPMKASLHEKAGLRKALASWMKKSDVQGIIDELVKSNIIKDGVFSWGGFLGKKPALMISMVASKKDPSKMYPQIKGISPAKKDQVFEPIVSEIPEFFVKESLEYDLLPGFSIKKAKAVNTNHIEKAPVKQKDVSQTPVEDELPW